MFCTFWLHNVLFATAACNFWTSELQKVLRGPQFFNIFTCKFAFRHSRAPFFDIWTSKSAPRTTVFNILTSKCAFRHSGVPFFDIWTSKSAPKLTCFVHFHFPMRFSPQRRTIFRHLNFKKCSETDVFCTCSLPNVLFTTAACNFSTSELQKSAPSTSCFVHFHVQTSELPKVLRHRQFSSIFTSKCGFRHSGVQFLMSSLGTYLRTRRFNRPTFRRTRHTNHWKNTAFRDFSNICLGCLFFLLTFALLHLLPSDLTACLICFSTLHIVRSLLFKLPSTIFYLLWGSWMFFCSRWIASTCLKLHLVHLHYVIVNHLTMHSLGFLQICRCLFLDVSEFSVRKWGQPNAFITVLHTLTPNRIRGSWHIYLHLVDVLMVNVPLDPKTRGKTCRFYTPKYGWFFSPLKISGWFTWASHADWFPWKFPHLRSRKFPSITTEEACDRPTHRPQGFFCSIKIQQDRRCFSWFWRWFSSEKMRGLLF